MNVLSSARRAVAAWREARFRYGAVFALVLTLLVFQVLAPDADWARAVAVALSGAALTIVVATSRERGPVRRFRALVVSTVAAVVVIGIWAGLLGPEVAFLIGTLIAATIPVALAGGLLRLIRDEGVTIQAVAGALTIYLLIGLLFASAISFVAKVQGGSYFVQASPVSNGDRVYYSFTVLTTTGFGDYTAAKPLGHALAVLEMLIGQLYLVTVIGILVGNFAGQRRR
jgi:Ion channel